VNRMVATMHFFLEDDERAHRFYLAEEVDLVIRDLEATIENLRASWRRLHRSPTDAGKRIAELEAENNRAWTAANRAEAKVQAWEATVVCIGLPMRMHATREQWGPGANEPVSVPHVTPEKLTSILDRLATAEAERDAARAEVAILRELVGDVAAMPVDIDAAIDAARSKE
jgi:hypothetical protein